MMKKMTRNLSSLLALAAIFIISAVSAELLASIDCGSSDAYTDPDNSISWSPDDDYVSNGDSEGVQNSNSLSHVMDTLRVFTTGNKNCYVIPVDQGTKILVRASFFYGNYDQKSKPPTFNLQFDGNDWSDVETATDSLSTYEVIYVVKGDSTSICLAQTNEDEYPFINALEIRSLDSTMYSRQNADRNRAFYLSMRIAYGTNATIRYSDDPYDRIWTPSSGGRGLIPVTTESPIFLSSGLDEPPQSMLQNAITTSKVTDLIRLGTVFPATDVPVYLNLYFSEVSQLDPLTDKRSFIVYQDDVAISNSISPPFGNFIEFNVNNVMVHENTTFDVVAVNSTLPPIVNGMEIFYISDPLTNGTNSKDVAGLVELQKTFEVLQLWSGDPCLPAPYVWEWVNCSLDATPRITALYLSGIGLSGELPDISSMDGLDTIELQNNSLSGPIPNFLGSLSNLKTLNLADNQFSGPIPTSLSKKSNLDLVVSGNPNLCTSDQKSCKTTPATTSGGSSGSPASGGSTKKKSSSKLPIILGVAVPIVVIIWAIICVFLILHFKRKRAIVSTVNPGQNGGANGGGINGQAMGKVGMAAFNAFGRNENTDTEHNTTSSNNETA